MGLKGSQKLAVLLCKLSDTRDTEPQPVSFFHDLFVNRGTGGLNDYWVDASLGNIDLNGTEVFEWKIIDKTQDEFLKDNPDRASKIQAAVDAFSVDRSKYAGVVAVFNVDVGDAGEQDGVLAGPNNLNVTFMAHETGHVFGLEHSFDQSSRKNADWSAPGEYYDRHDIMSAMNVHSKRHLRFGPRGPLLNAPNLDRMGWLDPARVWNSTRSNSSFSACLDLMSLGHPQIPGYLAAIVSGLYIEFRTQDGWDAGIPRPAVLIHRLQGVNSVVLASDKNNWVNDWQPGQVYGPSAAGMAIGGGTRITIQTFDLSGKKARICIDKQAQRPYQEGVVFVGSIAVGDGWVLLKDVLFRVPPKGGPLREVPGQVGALQLEELMEHTSFGAVLQLTSLQRAANLVQQKMTTLDLEE